MGRAKAQWMEMQEIRQDTRIAEKLGLTYEELNQTDWHVDEEASRDGILYGYNVYFYDGPKEILTKIIGLDANNQVWFSAADFDFDNDDYYFYNYEEQFEAIITNKHYYDNFHKEVTNLKKLNNIELNDELSLILKRQLYISAIGTLEAFLSETFINLTDENSDYFRNFIETFPDFSKQKFNLNEIIIRYEKLKNTARKEMLEVIYHNLDKVQNMYNTTFKIEFPNIEKLSKSVATRHDLVHRNGKTKKGTEVLIDSKTIDELLEEITEFVEQLSKTLNLNEQ